MSIPRPDDIGANVRFIQERIAELALSAGRKASEVRLVAVTKTQDWSRVQAAIQGGATIIGENRWQEARDKIPAAWTDLSPSATLEDACPRVGLHFIGHLQKNKIRKAVGFFDCIQSVDDAETLRIASQEALALGKTIEIMFEVNTSGEESKQGVRTRDELFSLIELGCELPSLRLKGLMTIGPLGADEVAIRRAFASLREDFRLAASRFDLSTSSDTDRSRVWDELSMGMSGDYPWAIAEGASLVRIGSAIFGPRLAPPTTVAGGR